MDPTTSVQSATVWRISRLQMSAVTSNPNIFPGLSCTLVNFVAKIVFLKLRTETIDLCVWRWLLQSIEVISPRLLTALFAGYVESVLVDVGSGTMCKECGKILMHRFDARRHVKMAHFHQQSYDCEVCGKRQKHIWALRDHMRKTHGQYVTK